MEQHLEDAVHKVRRSDALRVLKIIHGYGSSGRGGSTRTVVRNWAYVHRSRWRARIDGERYTFLDPETRVMRESVGAYPDSDLRSGNPGILVLWIR